MSASDSPPASEPGPSARVWHLGVVAAVALWGLVYSLLIPCA